MDQLIELKNKYQINIESDPDYDILQKLFLTNNIEIIQNKPDYSGDFCYFISKYFLRKSEYNLCYKYFILAVRKNDKLALVEFTNYCKDNKDSLHIEQYYSLAISQGNIDAMLHYAIYSKSNENYQEAEKYYLMAIEHGNSIALTHYADYLRKIKLDYPEMKKYYLLSIQKGCPTAMNNYAYYLRHVEKNYPEMKKYYIMAIENDSKTAMHNYADYLELIEHDYENMEKYLLLIIKKKPKPETITKLSEYYLNNKNYTKLFELLINYEPNSIKFYFSKIYLIDFEFDTNFINLLLKKKSELENINIPIFQNYLKLLNSKIDLMELHFKYSMNNLGFEQAKTDFIQRLAKN